MKNEYNPNNKRRNFDASLLKKILKHPQHLNNIDKKRDFWGPSHTLKKYRIVSFQPSEYH